MGPFIDSQSFVTENTFLDLAMQWRLDVFSNVHLGGGHYGECR
jgi:hypothetical protein